MLQVKNIRKKYVTGDLEQIALNDVSLNLRDNEFVAILGQSGSGKTTLLNVIGGLDRYDSGDLIINGISTKDYSDRDWDSYRNHTIGFVFQSYNLIPHQSVLSNVELALTISGISGKERRERAIDALNQVGLGNQLHKKPNQMSGGQMQRVAIARALVNNPDILLADEPTGALDSETSIQVMDLLKEVAKDRLVVMVTHNPELAEEYATRIVNLRDGKIIGDTDPYLIDDSQLDEPTHQNMGKASMSFLTSLALSFNNLKTKKGRTFLTSFAGSIGIIGIALILSLSNGVNTYIHEIEEDTLSEYPVTIATSDVDFTSMIINAAEASVDESAGEEVNERQTISSFFSQSKKNDLKSLKAYLESDECPVYEYANAIEYSYSVVPQIYRLDKDNFQQVNPNDSFSDLNRTYGAMSSMMPYNVFSSLPETESLYKEQYEVLEGHWPENPHEMVLVLSSDNCVTDITLYSLGLKDNRELDRMIKQYRDGQVVNEVSSQGQYKYKDFIGLQFKMIDASAKYQYDAKRKVYVDKSDNKDYMMDTIRQGETLEIVGIIRPSDSSKAAMLTPGISYPVELEYEVMDAAHDSEIVKEQLKHPKINVFTGKRFEDEQDSGFDSLFEFDSSALSNALSVNPNALNGNLFNGMDFSKIKINLKDLDINLSGIDKVDWAKLLKNVEIDVNQDALNSLFSVILQDYLQYASSDPSTNYAALPDAMNAYLNSDYAKQIIASHMNELIQNNVSFPSQEDTNQFIRNYMQGFVTYVMAKENPDMNQLDAYLNEYMASAQAQAIINDYMSKMNISNITSADLSGLISDLAAGYNIYAQQNGLPDPTKLQESFSQYISSSQGQQAIIQAMSQVIDAQKLESQLRKVLGEAMGEYSDVLENEMNNVMAQIMKQLAKQIGGSMGGAMSQLFASLNSMFSFDASAFEKAFNFSMNEKEFEELMMSMMTEGASSYESNLSKLNYFELDTPSNISIFPKDFDNKTLIIKMLNKYNKRMEKEDKDKVVSFTDYVATLMSSVTDIIDTISYVLIAFVAISLVVSSIMIGIITYISVLERTKEIGILRAIGASKPNISQVFNAETFIIGLLAGVLGIVISLLLLIPGNMIIHALTNGKEVSAILPWQGAIILVIISVILTLIGGIIPSRAAAKKDPVTALRSD